MLRDEAWVEAQLAQEMRQDEGLDRLIRLERRQKRERENDHGKVLFGRPSRIGTPEQCSHSMLNLSILQAFIVTCSIISFHTPFYRS